MNEFQSSPLPSAHPPSVVTDRLTVTPRPTSSAWAASMSATHSCMPCTEPGTASFEAACRW